MAAQITVGKYNFPDVISGDDFIGTTVTMQDADGDPIDLSSAQIRIAFRKDKNTGPVVKSISVGSGITLTDAVNGIFQIDAFTCTFGAGTYYHDWHFVLAGANKTLIRGTLEVVRDITN